MCRLKSLPVYSFQKGVYFVGKYIFNKLSKDIRDFNESEKLFKIEHPFQVYCYTVVQTQAILSQMPNRLYPDLASLARQLA